MRRSGVRFPSRALRPWTFPQVSGLQGGSVPGFSQARLGRVAGASAEVLGGLSATASVELRTPDKGRGAPIGGGGAVPSGRPVEGPAPDEGRAVVAHDKESPCEGHRNPAWRRWPWRAGPVLLALVVVDAKLRSAFYVRHGPGERSPVWLGPRICNPAGEARPMPGEGRGCRILQNDDDGFA